MPHRGRSEADEVLAAALAAGDTFKSAATAAKVSEKTVWRRMRDATFAARVNELRAGFMRQAAGRLAQRMTMATDTLVELLADKDSNVRARAASAILQHGIRVVEITEMRQEILEIKAVVFANRDQTGGVSP